VSKRRRVTERVGVLLAGVLLLVSAGLGATVVIPTLDEAMGETTGHARTYEEDAPGLAGMRVYEREGCWYCHTQQVRRTITDTALGDRLEAGDYDGQSPAMLGLERSGPDLTHAGTRFPNGGELRRSVTGGSVHTYGHLTDRELDALVAYLQSLR